MEKEEILAKSRQEQHGKDERELQIMQKASTVAIYIGFIAAFIISTLELLLLGSLSISNWAVYCAMLTGLFYVKYTALKQRHEAIVMIIYAMLTILFTAMYVYKIVA